MTTTQRTTARFALLIATLAGAPAWADTAPARCELTPALRAVTRVALACSFSQRQGFISIELADGRRFDLEPQGGRRYRDSQGRVATQRLSASGQTFRFPQETLRVDWDAGDLPAYTPGSAAADIPFDRTYTLGRVSLRVSSANQPGTNRVRVTPRGLVAVNTPLERDEPGRVVNAEFVDLDGDGAPELFVMLRGDGPRAPGLLLAVATNRQRSLSDITLPELTPEQARGWRGGDEFATVEKRLVQRFRVYRDGDADGAPSGGWRQLQYRLVPGEASWELRLDRMTEF